MRSALGSGKETMYTRINLCLELTRFRMSSTLISFEDEYSEYHSGEKEEQGLETGGYESTFLDDPVVSYLFERSNTIFNPTTYHGIYKYDGLVVFKVKKSGK